MWTSARSVRVSLLAIAIFLIISQPGYAEPMFMGLGDLPDGRQSWAHGISADGSTVVGGTFIRSFPDDLVAFRWTFDEGMVAIEDPTGDRIVTGSAVSATGSAIVGGGRNGLLRTLNEAFIWTANDGVVGLGFLPGVFQWSDARGVSADGSIVVGSSSFGSSPSAQAFRWTSNTGMVGLGLLPGRGASQATAISGDGSVIVGFSNGESQPSPAVATLDAGEAFRWTHNSGMVGLGLLPDGSSSQAHGTSADGSVVVGWAETLLGTEAFRWTAETGMIRLENALGAFRSSRAYATSADGSVIVGEAGGTAFIWEAKNGMRRLDQELHDLGLDLAGWRLSDAIDISSDGRTIVGLGTNPWGVWGSWIAVVPRLEALEIDIKPENDLNPINLIDRGLIPVAILGSNSFDVANVDVTTLAFGPEGASILHRRDEHFRDINGDGFTDVVSHYRTHESGIAQGDVEACISGMTFDGIEFEGCDSIRTFPACGLGFELALLLPGVMWLRQRRVHASAAAA